MVSRRGNSCHRSESISVPYASHASLCHSADIGSMGVNRGRIRRKKLDTHQPDLFEGTRNSNLFDGAHDLRLHDK